MFGYCCKCNEGNPGYYGSGGGSNSGGGLYFNPYGVGGGCDVCSTVPYALTAVVELDITCPCTLLGGTFELQHAGSNTTTPHLILGGSITNVCDYWVSSFKAKDEATCVESTSIPFVQVALFEDGGNYYWQVSVAYMEGPFVGEAYQVTGFSDCFQSLSASTFTYNPRFPCIVTSIQVDPA